MTAVLDAAGEIIGIDQHGNEGVWEYLDTDEGDCVGCGHVIYVRSKRIRTKRSGDGGWMIENGMALRAIPQQFTSGLVLEPWHLDCLDRYTLPWVIAPGRKIHRTGCVHARDDGHRFHGRRREVLWEQERLDETDPRHRYRGFCDLCAPIDFWWESYIGGQSVPGLDAVQAPLPPALLSSTKAPAQ